MKIVIVGYGDMFQSLIEGVSETGHKIVGVFRVDRTQHSPLILKFNDKYRPSDDYLFIKRRKLRDINARSVNSKEFREFLKKKHVDLVIVGSWGERFSVQTINTTKYGVVNVHPSLLPKYRGPNPYLQAILHGEKETGITFHLMDVNYDTGAILHQKVISIRPDDTGITLKHRCCSIAKDEVRVLLNHFKSKMRFVISQNENYATYQPRINLSETILDFKNETSVQIDRRIRALTPWTNSFIPFKNEFFSFDYYKICNKSAYKEPGTVIKKTDDSLYIVCRDKKVIQFASVKINRPFSKLLTKFYMTNVIKVNSKAE